MFSEERQIKISELLKGKSSIKVNELSEIFNVSESTIRRDLQEMEERGLLKRTHGGAVGVRKTNFEPTFKEKEEENQLEKTNVAEAAAAMIENGDTIILDSGTTTLELARHIKARNITVITNSIDVSAELSSRSDIEVIVTGGSLRINTRAMVGHIAETTISNFRVDKAFIGANGISLEQGITTPNIMEAQIKKVMMSVANQVILVADSSKFNQVSFSVICEAKSVNTIVTSSDIEDIIIEEFEEAGIEIIRKGE